MSKAKILTSILGKSTKKTAASKAATRKRPPTKGAAKKKEAGPKAQIRKAEEQRLNRRMKEKDEKKAATGREKRLLDLKSAMRQNRKRGVDVGPKITPEEAGRSAERVARGARLQQNSRLQNSYNGKKAQVAWLKQNNPSSSRIADLQKEMKKLEARADINTRIKVEPKRPTGEASQAIKAKDFARERKEFIEITQKLNAIGNEKLVKRLGKKFKRMTDAEIKKLRKRKAELKKRMDAYEKASGKK
jgi:hypothetical protein|tara:strand:- start:811 stop:1548 length:738 start_codon:yes stop_codon:yes gene_type:complete